MTKPLFYGAAASCAIGLVLGIWLKPPTPHIGSQAQAAPLASMTSPLDASASATDAGYSQPVTAFAQSDPTVAQDTAAVSPPAAEKVKMASLAGNKARSSDQWWTQDSSQNDEQLPPRSPPQGQADADGAGAPAQDNAVWDQPPPPPRWGWGPQSPADQDRPTEPPPSDGD